MQILPTGAICAFPEASVLFMSHCLPFLFTSSCIQCKIFYFILLFPETHADTFLKKEKTT